MSRFRGEGKPRENALKLATMFDALLNAMEFKQVEPPLNCSSHDQFP